MRGARIVYPAQAGLGEGGYIDIMNAVEGVVPERFLQQPSTGLDILVKIRENGGLTILNRGSQTFVFSHVWGWCEKDERPLIVTAELVAAGDDNDIWQVIGKEPGNHRLYPGEMLYVPTREPTYDPADVTLVAGLLANRFDAQLLLKWPRFAQVSEFFVYKSDCQNWSQFPDPAPRRQDWMSIWNHQRYATGVDLRHGWATFSMDPWGGYDDCNGFYDMGIARFIATVLHAPNQYILQWYKQTQRCSLGFRWAGDGAGRWCGEKGISRRGMNAAGKFITNRSKLWDGPAWITWLYTKDPVIKECLDARWQSILSQPLWSGAWGARIEARTIDNIMWKITCTADGPEREAAIAELERRLANLITLSTRNMRGLWLNSGNGGRAPTSPWMMGELLFFMWAARKYVRWDRFVRTEAEYEQDLIATMDACVEEGTYDIGPYLATRYRFDAYGNHNDPTHSTHPSLTGWLRPIIKILADREADDELNVSTHYQDLLAKADHTVFGVFGGGWSKLPADGDLSMLVPKDQLWADHPEGGPGWVGKVPLTLFHAARVTT